MLTFSDLEFGDQFVWGAALPGLTSPPAPDGPYTKLIGNRYCTPLGRIYRTGAQVSVVRVGAPIDLPGLKR